MKNPAEVRAARGEGLHLTAACVAGKAAQRLTRALGRGSGSALPGLAALKVHPGALAALGRSLSDGCVLITGTNGKTTTASMLRRILSDAGWDFAGNPSGSNLSRGIVSSLLQTASMTGRVRAPFAVLEVDEAALPAVAKALPTRAIAVLNLFRDQLDRYGEIDSLARVIASALPQADTVYLNADDPLVASLGLEAAATSDVRYFGIDFDGSALGDTGSDPNEVTDSDRCPVCHANLVYGHVSLSHLGEYRCPGGDFSRPPPSVEAQLLSADDLGDIPLELRDGRSTAWLELPLPGIHNVYDAVAAAAVASYLGVDVGVSADTLGRMSPAFGRGESFSLAGRTIHLLLVKNPASFNQTMHVLRRAAHDPWLILVNDNIADGTDVSWLWDVGFESLRGEGVSITAGGSRGFDLAVRLKYAGIDSPVEASMDTGLDRLVGVLPPGGHGYVIATYTAMLEMRKIIGRRTTVRDLSR